MLRDMTFQIHGSRQGLGSFPPCMCVALAMLTVSPAEQKTRVSSVKDKAKPGWQQSWCRVLKELCLHKNDFVLV